jgi:hypothetical protein
VLVLYRYTYVVIRSRFGNVYLRQRVHVVRVIFGAHPTQTHGTRSTIRSTSEIWDICLMTTRTGTSYKVKKILRVTPQNVLLL